MLGFRAQFIADIPELIDINNNNGNDNSYDDDNNNIDNDNAINNNSNDNNNSSRSEHLRYRMSTMLLSMEVYTEA